jgi:muramoyltetrapeptide carboxypeptidase
LSIGVCALSGSVDPLLLERAVAAFERAGHRVRVADNALARWRYFAGSDAQRVNGFHALVDDPSLDLIIAARGGYGLSRLMAAIDWQRVVASRKLLCGFSDFTALNLACMRHGLVTVHGPTACTDFGGDYQGEARAGHEYMEANFWPLLRGEPVTVAVQTAIGCAPRTLEGTLWGGNLSLVSDLHATPWFPEIDNGLLFLEDIGEQPYVIERMLLHLKHAGVLDRQRAILLGNFTDCEPAQTLRYPYAMHEVVESLRALLTIPVLTHFPFGHVAQKAALAYGALATLEITPDGYALHQRLGQTNGG